MPAFVTRDWSKELYQKGVRAHMEFAVTGVLDQDEASAAVPFQKGSTHPKDSRLIAEQPVAENQPGPLYFPVTVEFTNPTPSTTPGGGDPIDDPPQIFWEPGTTYETFYRDVYGNPIVNSAGFPFQPQQKAITSLFLNYERNESTYDPGQSLTFMNKINSNSFSIDVGNGQQRSVAPGQCFCHFIGPVQSYNSTHTLVRVGYRFEFRDYFPGISSPQRSAFQLLLRDQGLQGWYTLNNQTLWGSFTGSTDPKDYTTEDVMLNGAGAPMRTDVYVKGQTAIAAPFAINADVIPPTTSSPAYLIYDQYESISFAGMGL